MDFLAWLALVAVVIWAYLLAFRGRFWTTGQRLGRLLDAAPEPAGAWPSVAVVVPARDEAALLPTTLASLLAQDYPGPATVVLVDDHSRDGTAEVARRVAEGGRLGLQVVQASPTPPGWAGKVWALREGLRHAGTPDWVLFTDADIHHPTDSLTRLVRAGEGARLDMVSLMARLRTATFWESLIVPAFVYFFAQLYPFASVNRASGRVAAAAGGCVLLRRGSLLGAGGLEAIRAATIDDVALARAVKAGGGRLWLGLADEVRSVRPYDRLGELWRMVTRSAFTQLRYSPTVLAVAVAGLLLTYAVPPAAVIAGSLTGDTAAVALGAAAWLAMAASYLPTIRYYGRPAATALLLPLTASLYLAMTVDSARRHWTGGVAWKGRNL